MKGTLLVEFLSFVEERYGPERVEDILQAVEPGLSTAGAYTSVGNYPHGELLDLLEALVQRSSDTAAEIVGEFAAFLMQAFERMHPEFFEDNADVFDFLRSVGEKIHVEVEKLYANARPPKITVADFRNHGLLVTYKSSRPMAGVAHALVEAAGNHFNQPLSVEIASQSSDDKSRTMLVTRL